MTDDPLPTYFQVFLDGLRNELREIKSDLKDVGRTVDAIHEEARKTNGTVKHHAARIDAIEQADRDALHLRIEERHHHRNRLTQLVTALIGAGGALVLILVTEALKHVS